MSRARGLDLAYAIIGLMIAYAISLRTDAATATLIGGLMILCYLAGGQKFRVH